MCVSNTFTDDVSYDSDGSRDVLTIWGRQRGGAVLEISRNGDRSADVYLSRSDTERLIKRLKEMLKQSSFT